MLIYCKTATTLAPLHAHDASLSLITTKRNAPSEYHIGSFINLAPATRNKMKGSVLKRAFYRPINRRLIPGCILGRENS